MATSFVAGPSVQMIFVLRTQRQDSICAWKSKTAFLHVDLAGRAEVRRRRTKESGAPSPARRFTIEGML
jgi:hypothetical protein